MAQYVDRSLAPNERILRRGRWPLIHWIGAWLILAVLGIAVVGVFIFLWAVVVMTTTEFAVTDQRVIYKRGWLNHNTAELSVESVEGVNLQQSIFGRIFGYGRILVTGTGDAHIMFPPMAEPVLFRRAIEEARSLDRDER